MFAFRNSDFAIPHVFLAKQGVFSGTSIATCEGQFRKETFGNKIAMTGLKTSFHLIALAGLSTFAAPNYAEAKSNAEALHIYAGPQSSAPMSPVHVTVEALNASGASATETTITLSYYADNEVKNLTGKTVNGLVSFRVPSKKTAGLMEFSAAAGNISPAQAAILVVAGQPLEFRLQTSQGQKTGSIDITSETIKDRFGNKVSNQSLVSVNWVDQSGLIASKIVQLSNNQLDFSTQCPSRFSGPLRIQATLKNSIFSSTDISSLCPSSGVGS